MYSERAGRDLQRRSHFPVGVHCRHGVRRADRSLPKGEETPEKGTPQRRDRDHICPSSVSGEAKRRLPRKASVRRTARDAAVMIRWVNEKRWVAIPQGADIVAEHGNTAASEGGGCRRFAGPGRTEQNEGSASISNCAGRVLRASCTQTQHQACVIGAEQISSCVRERRFRSPRGPNIPAGTVEQELRAVGVAKQLTSVSSGVSTPTATAAFGGVDRA